MTTTLDAPCHSALARRVSSFHLGLPVVTASLLVVTCAGLSGTGAAEPTGRVGDVREGRNERDGRIFYVHIPGRPKATPPRDEKPRLFFWFHGGEMLAQTQFDEWMRVRSIRDQWIVVCPQAKAAGRGWDAGQDGAFVDQLFSELTEAYAVAPADVVVGGFSQGGSMACAFAFQNQNRVGGLLACSCLIPRPIPKSRAKMPVMWYYSANDPYHDMAKPVETEREIKDAGYRMFVEKDNVGHALGPRVTVAFDTLRKRVLEGEKDTASP